MAESRAPEDSGAPGNRLSVTCGSGVSLVPMRINPTPEIAFVTLVPARPGS